MMVDEEEPIVIQMKLDKRALGYTIDVARAALGERPTKEELEAFLAERIAQTKAWNADLEESRRLISKLDAEPDVLP